MFCAGRDDVDPCRIDTAVPENICEFGDILFNTVEDAGEQMAQIVREYLFGIYLCLKAEASLSKKSGYGWAFSHLYGTIRMGDERCLNEENWTVES